MKSSKEVLSTLSNYCYVQFTLYKFNEGSLKTTDKYREGRLTGIDYIGDLVFYYLQEEKKICNKMIEQIDRQMKSYSCLNDGDYKSGLYDAMNDILDEYKRLDTSQTPKKVSL